MYLKAVEPVTAGNPRSDSASDSKNQTDPHVCPPREAPLQSVLTAQCDAWREALPQGVRAPVSEGFRWTAKWATRTTSVPLCVRLPQRCAPPCGTLYACKPPNPRRPATQAARGGVGRWSLTRVCAPLLLPGNAACAARAAESQPGRPAFVPFLLGRANDSTGGGAVLPGGGSQDVPPGR